MTSVTETWQPEADCDEIAAVYQAVGAATAPSMWGEDGVFQEQRAIAIAEGLIDHLERLGMRFPSRHPDGERGELAELGNGESA